MKKRLEAGILCERTKVVASAPMHLPSVPLRALGGLPEELIPAAGKRTVVLFRRCLRSVAANSDYKDWLVNRNLSEQNRGPAYELLKSIFVARLGARLGVPSPAWATGTV